MGFFDWLTPGKSNTEELADKIWLNRQAKYVGIAQDVACALADNESTASVVLLAQFPSELPELKALVDRAGLDRRLVPGIVAKDWKGPVAREAEESNHILIVVSERHPLRSHDDAIVEVARSLPCRSRIMFHLSLEDPLLRQFSGQWLSDMLRRLGLEEGECIESKMVSRRLEQAQRKVEEHASGDWPAGSAEEWFQRNCPTG